MEYLIILGLSFGSLLLLFGLIKLSGDKQISQLSMFDYVVGITIGSIAAELATGLDTNPLYNVIAIVVYSVCAYIIVLVSEKSRKARKIINGKPIVLMENGNLYYKNFSRARIDLNDFLTMCRIKGYFDISQVQVAIIEHNGDLSILPKSSERPAIPKDMNLSPEQETIPTTVVMDGVLLTDNIKLANIDQQWLIKQLKTQGYSSVGDVFYAACDNKGSVFAYSRAKDDPRTDRLE